MITIEIHPMNELLRFNSLLILVYLVFIPIVCLYSYFFTNNFLRDIIFIYNHNNILTDYY
jgi:hypothetical protein